LDDPTSEETQDFELLLSSEITSINDCNVLSRTPEPPESEEVAETEEGEEEVPADADTGEVAETEEGE